MCARLTSHIWHPPLQANAFPTSTDSSRALKKVYLGRWSAAFSASMVILPKGGGGGGGVIAADSVTGKLGPKRGPANRFLRRAWDWDRGRGMHQSGGAHPRKGAHTGVRQMGQ